MTFTYEMYRNVFLIAGIACGVLFVLSVILFFALRIPKVISDLTGRTARKAIENIRLHNEQTGDKSYQSSPVNLQRGKITDKISHSGRVVHREPTPFGVGPITERIAPLNVQHGKTVGETLVLAETDQTTVLDSGMGEPSVLDTATYFAHQEFTVEFEITYIHSSEIIE